MPDFSQFKGTLPYASELLGVFQPLLGWRGRRGRMMQRRALVQRVSALATRFAPAATAAAGAVQALPPAAPTGNAVIDSLTAQVAARHPDRDQLTADEWRAALTPEAVRSAVENATAALPRDDAATGAATPAAALQMHFQGTGAVIETLLAQQPAALNSLLLSPPEIFAPDFLSRFPRLADAILSPVGLLHLFREYFFEMDSFLGPPVGHVWISPGSMVELVESTVRRRLVERSIESSIEITTRSETTTETKDELSEAIKQENADDMRIGVSASGGFNIGVAHGEASASFNLDQARKMATEQTHKRSRSQTEKKSTEIRQSFKTTFRTVSEQTDTTSKRYVLQNTTGELINYELRRKMRRVAVQLQHLGTRLCWQYYVDSHAAGLRISRLVHLASLSDADLGLRPPEAPPPAETYEEDFIAKLPWHPIQRHSSTNWDEYWVGGKSGGESIQWQWDFARPPKPGYELQTVGFSEMLPQGDLGGRPELFTTPAFEVPAPVQSPPPGSFRIALPEVNFHSANGIRVRLHLRFGPTKDTQEKADKTFADRQKDFEEQRARAYQEAFVRAVRDRVKAAGEVRARNFDDLREEERHCLYRRLIDTLTHGGTAMADKHVAAELIRQVFDVDAMLYFVAPDWWDPAARRVATLGVSTPEVNPSGKTAELKPANLVEWGEHVSAIGDPYLVTEESRPAPLGASIGWVIELDGDPMRNAFLNAAWAKVVVPMRPGREREAIAWLRDQAEQDVGLKDSYQPQPGDPQEWAGKTLEDVLDALIGRIRGEQTTANTVDANVEALPGERVFQNGFDPLAGGVRFDAKELSVFDQWVEALATDQVVAVEYEKP